MVSTPTEVELEAGGLRVRCSAPGVALSVVSSTALALWQEAERATPRREVGFTTVNPGQTDRRGVTDQGLSDAGGSTWDSGRDGR